jgi:hypothetical protein
MTISINPVARQSVPKAPFCAHCDIPMKIKTITPTMFAQTVDEIVYCCPACEAETKKSIKRTR